MSFQYVSRATAVALMEIVVPTLGASHVSDLARDAREGHVTHFLGPEGVKIGAQKHGCVVRFHVAGYAHDGGDVDRALARLQKKP